MAATLQRAAAAQREQDRQEAEAVKDEAKLAEMHDLIER